jgi:hypothetical protein
MVDTEQAFVDHMKCDSAHIGVVLVQLRTRRISLAGQTFIKPSNDMFKLLLLATLTLVFREASCELVDRALTIETRNFKITHYPSLTGLQGLLSSH